MTLDERRAVLHIICDLEQCHKRKEIYKAYLESAQTGKFAPGNWIEICDRIATEQGSAWQERMAAIFLPHYTFATEGLDSKTAQGLLDSVREEREGRNIQ